MPATRRSPQPALVLLALLALLTPIPVPATAAPTLSLTRTGQSELDTRALYFVSYDGLVNNESFQQSGILSHAGYQYAAWYTADRSAVVARRALPSGAWQRVVLPHRLSADDSHNVISLGISPADGRLHVAMDTHNNPVHYTVSEAGLVTDPAAHAWSATAFGPIQRTLGGVDLGSITYPQFTVTPTNRLQLSYRTGGSGNGINEIAEYDAGTWRRLGRWSSATGSWTGPNGVTSTTRNMYLHGFGYDPAGRLHAAFTWREGNTGVLCASGGLTNHDTGYVYSDDQGRTWRNSAGAPVGSTGTQPVSVTSAGLVVDPLDPNHGLMNQESQAVDSAGNPHVVISYVPGRFTQCVTDYASQRASYGRTFLVSRSGSGWTKQEVPVAPGATGRTRIFFDRADNAYLVMPFGRIVTASKASGWKDWTVRYDGAADNAFGEVLVDTSRVLSAGVFSVMYQQRSTGTTPSSLRVNDFRIG